MFEDQHTIVDDVARTQSANGCAVAHHQSAVSVNAGATGVGVGTDEGQYASAQLGQACVCARDHAREHTAVARVVHRERAACGQRDVAGAVDVAAVQGDGACHRQRTVNVNVGGIAYLANAQT